MNEGKPYPRSGCDVCGSMLGPGRLVCTQGVEPRAGQDPKYYIPTKLENPSLARDKYAAIIKSSYSQAGYDPGDPSETVYYDSIKYFDTVEALKSWYQNNMELRYGGDTVKQIIKYQELKVTTEVSINVT